MQNYIMINGQRIWLTKEQVEQIKASFGDKCLRLGDVAAGGTALVGSHEMIVLDHIDGTTLLLRKDSLGAMEFGENNNYNGSYADGVCNEFAEELAEIVGEGNILLHDVDLTADDGLKDYGVIQRKASLRTAQMQRKYVEILDGYRLDGWEWLATAYSTPAHDNGRWVKCVSPSGCIRIYGYGSDDGGVRPFCILKSDIFVSK